MGVAKAVNRFIYVDFGSYGNDVIQIYLKSKFNVEINNKQRLEIPEEKYLPGTISLSTYHTFWQMRLLRYTGILSDRTVEIT